MVRRERSQAPRGFRLVANDLLRFEAVRGRSDAVALALDDGERDALGVVRDEDLVDAARVVSAVVHCISKNQHSTTYQGRCAPAGT